MDWSDLVSMDHATADLHNLGKHELSLFKTRNA